jgi:hypothetical protein
MAERQIADLGPVGLRRADQAMVMKLPIFSFISLRISPIGVLP